MAYEPTNWKAGDVVTSAKLNKMEQGIVKNNVVECMAKDITLSSNAALNKTWQEIWDNNYTSIMITNDSSKQYGSIMGISKTTDDSPYIVIIATLGSPKTFSCISPDDYPSYTPAGGGK